MSQQKERQKPPFRFDIVGSFLRPEALKKARAAFLMGHMDAQALAAVEDAAIIDLVNRQKAVGLKVLTDGEFRRSWWHLDFFWGLNGVEKSSLGHGYQFHGESTRPETASIKGRISGSSHPFVRHFEFLNKLADDNHIARQTIPAPAQFWAELQRPENKAGILAVYSSEAEAKKDIVKAYRTVVMDLYQAGCRNIQMDDCTWGMLADARFRDALGVAPVAPSCACHAHDGEIPPVAVADILAQEYYELNNAVLENLPSDLIMTTHVCRGNYHSTWASSGGYETVAPYLFAHEDVSAFYLEYDTERAGDFSPLRYVPEGKMVVLGLFSSKSGDLEDRKEILNRIEEARQYVPLERLCISPQCGFASTEEGNILTEAQQWAKLALIRDIAEEVWA